MSNLEEKIENAAAYIARCKCGCNGIIMATVDIPEHTDETAKEVASCIRNGYAVEHTSVVFVREFTKEHGFGCLVEKSAREAKAARTLVMTNFVTGQEVPAGRIPNSSPDEPPEKWIEGWNDCMEGRAKKSTFGMSTPEHNDYIEGYEAAERD